jgi:hypothetical protein
MSKNNDFGITSEMLEKSFEKDKDLYLHNLTTKVIEESQKEEGYTQMCFRTNDPLNEKLYMIAGSIAVKGGLEFLEYLKTGKEECRKVVKDRFTEVKLDVDFIHDWYDYVHHLYVSDIEEYNDYCKDYVYHSIDLSNPLRVKMLKMLSSLVIPVNLAVPVYELKRNQHWTFNEVIKFNKLVTEDSEFDGKTSIVAFENLHSDPDYNSLLKAALKFSEIGKLSIVFFDLMLSINELPKASYETINKIFE